MKLAFLCFNLLLFLGQKRLKSDSSKNSFGDNSQVDENLEIIQAEAETSQQEKSVCVLLKIH